MDFKPIYTEKFKIANPVFWSILFNNILTSQNDSQNGENSRHAKKNLTLRLTFSISNVVFKVPNVWAIFGLEWESGIGSHWTCHVWLQPIETRQSGAKHA